MRPLWFRLGLYCLFLFTPAIAIADSRFEVVDHINMDGHDGFVVEAWESEVHLDQVFFVFEEDGYLRMYADRDGDETEWHVRPDLLFFCPTQGLQVGDTWPAYHDLDAGSNTATVVAEAGVETFFGFFPQAFKIEVRPDADPQSRVDVTWAVPELGIVAIGSGDGGPPSGLTTLELVGGWGTWPMWVGNRWTFAGPVVPAESLTWGKVKSLFAR
jgi:hypothetical protein